MNKPTVVIKAMNKPTVVIKAIDKRRRGLLGKGTEAVVVRWPWGP
jgi:hypothetical protein